MNRNLAWAIGLALPLIGFGYSWATTHQAAQLGEEWLIPVKGYDPRDLLRGHFIQYRYDWPVEKAAKSEGDEETVDISDELNFASSICIEGKAPNIARASNASDRIQPFGSTQDIVNEVKKPLCAIIARASYGSRREVQGLDSGIFYVSQAKAPGLEQKLRDPKLQGMIRVKIREDGVMRPVAMEFRPRINDNDRAR